jgi:signal transduction histidine kinase
VTLRCFPVADRVVLEVADTGLGMSEHEQEQLFERFYRTAAADEHAIQGTGLGLTIVKAFVEAHAGAITVTSSSGAGTTFRVELPLAGPVLRPVA